MHRFLQSFVIISILTALFSTDFANGQDNGKKEDVAKKDDAAKKELAALPRHLELRLLRRERPRKKVGSRQFVISDKTLTYREGVTDKIETTIDIDPTKKQKEFTQTFKDGPVYPSIYVLADNYLLLCGHRDKAKKRPTVFSVGDNDGGEFLILLKKQP